MISLPNDVKKVSESLMRNYQVKTIWFSKVHNFTGTEEDFVKNGYAYRYVEYGDFRRLVTEQNKMEGIK